jgi:hypothetical protein
MADLRVVDLENDGKEERIRLAAWIATDMVDSPDCGLVAGIAEQGTNSSALSRLRAEWVGLRERRTCVVSREWVKGFVGYA